MQTCKDCGHDYNEFTSGTPASEHRCDDCIRRPLSSKEQNLLRGIGWQGVTPKIACRNCGSKDLEGWVSGGGRDYRAKKGYTCASCGHDQTTQIDEFVRDDHRF
tara:strand:- start:23 stop:334 length:312 start_codon:yes stop_codon:yes gene_type:complete